MKYGFQPGQQDRDRNDLMEFVHIVDPLLNEKDDYPFPCMLLPTKKT